MKRCINLHLPDGEHAWLKVFAKRSDVTMTWALRDMIRDHMRRELAAEAIRAGLRCAWQDCTERPALDGGDRPTLCREHQKLAEERVREMRRSRRSVR